MPFVFDKHDAFGMGRLQAGDAGNLDRAVSEDAAAEFLGEIAQGLLHGCLLSLSGVREHNASAVRASAPGPTQAHRRLSTAGAGLRALFSSGDGPRATGRDSGVRNLRSRW